MFRFKQFEISDDASAMKIGTDGVLLGAWADVSASRSILDIGTGTGLVALMSAQRATDATVCGVEIDHSAASEARLNVSRTPWHDRITITEADIRAYRPDVRYDHIVTNPPFFLSSLHSPDGARTVARHATTLTYDDIVDAAECLLTEGGRLSIVLPTDCAALFRRVVFERLWLSRILDVATREGEAPKRTLMEFVLQMEPIMPRHDNLVIHAADGSYTEKYRCLTEEFYLNF